MRKLFILLFLSIFLLSFISATDSFGIFKQSENIRLKQVCSDATYINISSISYPNSSVAVSNIAMTSSGNGEFYYDFNLTESKGRYDVTGISDGCENTFLYYFEITYTGKVINSAQGILYIALIFVMILVFVGVLFGIRMLPSSNNQDEEGRILSINYLKYFRPVLWTLEWMLFIAVLFLTSNLAFAYLNEDLFAQILFTLFKVSFAITPIIVIVWMIWIYVQMFHDKKFQKLLNRGIFPQGKL